MDTALQIAAAKRFPGYRVQGDGEWALACPATRTVTLYVWALLAKTDKQVRHSNFDCVPEHKLVHLEPQKVSTVTVQVSQWE